MSSEKIDGVFREKSLDLVSTLAMLTEKLK